jgi:hypothetical protein
MAVAYQLELLAGLSKARQAGLLTGVGGDRGAEDWMASAPSDITYAGAGPLVVRRARFAWAARFAGAGVGLAAPFVAASVPAW